MDYLQQFIDLHRQGIDPEVFAAALALRHIRNLINYGGSEIGRPDFDSALHPHHLEAFLCRALERPWKDERFAQEWRRLQQVLPLLKDARHKGQTLSQEDLERAKSDQESMEHFSVIDFAVDCYAYVSSSRVYPENPTLRNWAINGYMLAWRRYFLKEDESEEEQGESTDDNAFLTCTLTNFCIVYGQA